MSLELKEVEKFLKQYNMKLGRNKYLHNRLIKQLNRENIVSRSMRCVYSIENFIIKTSSDATGSRIPIGGDQCLNEYNIYNATDENLLEFKDIFCPVYAIYESKFLYLTIHKHLTPLTKNNNSHDTIYSYIENNGRFANHHNFFTLLEKFKTDWVSDIPEIQHEYCKLSTFGHDEYKNLYVLDYGML